MGEIDRRTFVKLGGAGAAALIFGYGPFTERVWAQPRFPDYPFKLGVASGDPLPDGVVLWTRLAPDPLNGGGMPDKKVPVQWQVATDEGFSNVVLEGSTFARPELAHSVHVEVGGLNPGSEYFYRFRAGRDLSPVGRTKTAPAAGAGLAEMSFAIVSCQQYEHGYFTAYRRMAEQEQLDLVFHLGDYIYEYGPNEYVAPGGNVRAHSGPEIVTLSDYRNRHAQYRTDEDLQAAHAAFPWAVTWDDHEVENNYADEVPEARTPTPTTEAFLRRRAAAYQAYYEHMPLRRSSVPTGPDMLLYRRLAYGNLAEFNVLDTRQYRDDQAANDGTDPPNPESLDPNRTLTGNEQEQWLLNGLAASGATWNVLAQQVFFAQRDFNTDDTQRFSMDAWDGYVGSRNRISNFIQERGSLNPVVLTGDVHNNWACDLKANYDDPASATFGSEFVGTSVTSGGDGADTSPNQENVVAENPHIKFFNGQRGYVRCTLTPEQWRADYRVLPFVKQPGAPVYTRASFAIEAGNPGLQQVDANAVQGTRVSSALVESDAKRIKAQEEAGRRKNRR
ncbi:twin-arginine translocation signal domain-containing protein [Rubrobacter tropicus]|uniref:Twin-arginine translocation signal domain-containing protein n=1 Tax=Rubrobacter tropicus TaxID=2653851 RepID=A0A6G8QFM4_9ACTN|nr:twin-arginine translocation signal domain-containing protein [Rubrobacter tropicus]